MNLGNIREKLLEQPELLEGQQELEIKQQIEIEKAPKLVFVVPYRDRELQQIFFENHMKKTILSDKKTDEYKILYVNQNDNCEFNRGALKNIGFLFAKTKWPNEYKNIVFVFNDIDTMPIISGYLHYDTTKGIIKHFYGFTFALGGIFSIIGSDFEYINGFPNFWGWGYEDNMIQQRAINAGLIIDRSEFSPMFSKNIIQLQDGKYRNVNRGEYDRFLKNTNEGILDINNLVYEYDSNTGFIDVTTFNTGTPAPLMTQSTKFDLTTGSNPFATITNKKPKKVQMFLN